MVARTQRVEALGARSVLSDGKQIPCVVMRGGTSRGLFFHEQDLPSHRVLRDRVIMGAVGAPDPRQVDGLGGADMLLSKVAIVSCSMDADVDIECEFANITPGKEKPTYGTNCGNLVAAVALFAIDEGLVSTQQQRSSIRIRNRNSGSIVLARVGEIASRADDRGIFSGMSRSGVCIELDFINPIGTVLDTLLPTGQPWDTFELNCGRTVKASVVDAGALYVFTRAADFGLTATESAEQLSNNSSARAELEQLRSEVAHRLGFADSADDATRISPDVPKLAFVATPTEDSHQHRVDEDGDQIDLVSRIVSSQNIHQAYAVTGAIATAVAAAVPDSVVQKTIGKRFPAGKHQVCIGHPSGRLTCRFENLVTEDIPVISRAGLMRTARRIMRGSVVVPNDCF